MATPQKQLQTFISYSRVNQQFAIKLACELKSAGYSVWMDQFDIPTGSRWDDEIEKALHECEIFLFIMTPASIESENAKDEVGYAIDHGKHILPVLLEDCNIPFRLRRLQYVDFTKMNFNEGINSAKELLSKLVNEIELSRRRTKDPGSGVEPAGDSLSATSDVKTIPTKRRSYHTTPQQKRQPAKWMLMGAGILLLGGLVVAGLLVIPPLFAISPTPSQSATVPAPTKTLAPSLTAEPTAIQITQTPAVLRSFTEEFDENSLWNLDWSLRFRHSDIKKENNFKYAVENGDLIVNESYENVWGYFLYNPSITYDNVEMEVVVSGLRSIATLGLVCHFGEQGWYEFDINGGGEYFVRYVDNMDSGRDEDWFIVKYGYVSDFQYSTERVSENVIRIRCDGKNLSLRVNETQLLNKYPSRFAPEQGQIGIAMRSFDAYPIEVVVKSIKVREP